MKYLGLDISSNSWAVLLMKCDWTLSILLNHCTRWTFTLPMGHIAHLGNFFLQISYNHDTQFSILFMKIALCLLVLAVHLMDGWWLYFVYCFTGKYIVFICRRHNYRWRAAKFWPIFWHLWPLIRKRSLLCHGFCITEIGVGRVNQRDCPIEFA